MQLYYTTSLAQSASKRGARVTVWRYGFHRAARPVARAPGATAIWRLTGDRLLVGAAGGGVDVVSSRTGRVREVWSAAGARIVGIARGGQAAWVTQHHRSLMKVPLAGRATARATSLRGLDRNITAIAYDANGRAYYTAPGGDFGTLDLKHAVTHRWYSGFAAAHDVLFDRFTHDLMLVGDDRIAQIDPRTFGSVSELNLDQLFGRLLNGGTCDEASTNDRGGLVVACGRVMVTIKIGPRRRLASTSTRLSAQRVSHALYDIAPVFTGTARLDRRSRRRGCRPHHCMRTPYPAFTG
jgi:hypothetical protein